MGSREGIYDYLKAMVTEMDYWKTRENCRIDMPGDDQSIHNYLYYTNQLPNARSIPHRTGPIHVVGYQAARIFKRAEKEAKEKGLPIGNYYVKGDKRGQWLPEMDGLIDTETGLIINHDGSPSAQVHQFDR